MTVLHEYKKMARQSSIIFTTSWHRLVIDEAHCIRNCKSLSWRAVREITAACRWAVTGTPVHNRLSDFGSLLRFLRAHPYTSREAFQSDIINVWDTHVGHEPAARLKKLALAIMLRRSKKTLELPERTNTIIPLQFSNWEAIQYRKLVDATLQSLDDVLDAQHLPVRSYPNMLTKINLLRRFCDMGMLACPHLESSKKNHRKDQIDEWTTREAQEAFESLTAFGPLHCARCGLDDMLNIDSLDDPRMGAAHLTQCFRFLCSICSIELTGGTMCHHHPPCPVASVALRLTPSGVQTPEQSFDQQSEGLPAKVEAISRELKAVKGEKR